MATATLGALPLDEGQQPSGALTIKGLRRKSAEGLLAPQTPAPALPGMWLDHSARLTLQAVIREKAREAGLATPTPAPGEASRRRKSMEGGQAKEGKRKQSL